MDIPTGRILPGRRISSVLASEIRVFHRAWSADHDSVTMEGHGVSKDSVKRHVVMEVGGQPLGIVVRWVADPCDCDRVAAAGVAEEIRGRWGADDQQILVDVQADAEALEAHELHLRLNAALELSDLSRVERVHRDRAGQDIQKLRVGGSESVDLQHEDAVVKVGPFRDAEDVNHSFVVVIVKAAGAHCDGVATHGDRLAKLVPDSRVRRDDALDQLAPPLVRVVAVHMHATGGPQAGRNRLRRDHGDVAAGAMAWPSLLLLLRLRCVPLHLLRLRRLPIRHWGSGSVSWQLADAHARAEKAVAREVLLLGCPAGHRGLQHRPRQHARVVDGVQEAHGSDLVADLRGDDVRLCFSEGFQGHISSNEHDAARRCNGVAKRFALGSAREVASGVQAPQHGGLLGHLGIGRSRRTRKRR
mmetsp:Transcript_9413/g.35245  ORF Transcript_9413/g.35245 Transcript_9413/m.35245 type:complete len:416 (-) Transcript_9413:8-1255(-)